MYHALEDLVDSLAHDCPKMYGYVLPSRNLRANVSTCIASLSLPRAWKWGSAEIIWFLQPPDPLPWKVLRWRQLNPFSFIRFDVMIGQGLTTWEQWPFASTYNAKYHYSLEQTASVISRHHADCQNKLLGKINTGKDTRAEADRWLRWEKPNSSSRLWFVFVVSWLFP